MGVHCLPLRPKAAVRPSPISLFCTYGEISLLAKNYCTGAPVRNVIIISSFSMLGPLVWNMQASSSLNGFLYRPLHIHGSPLLPPSDQKLFHVCPPSPYFVRTGKYPSWPKTIVQVPPAAALRFVDLSSNCQQFTCI